MISSLHTHSLHRPPFSRLAFYPSFVILVVPYSHPTFNSQIPKSHSTARWDKGIFTGWNGMNREEDGIGNEGTYAKFLWVKVQDLKHVKNNWISTSTSEPKGLNKLDVLLQTVLEKLLWTLWKLLLST